MVAQGKPVLCSHKDLERSQSQGSEGQGTRFPPVHNCPLHIAPQDQAISTPFVAGHLHTLFLGQASAAVEKIYNLEGGGSLDFLIRIHHCRFHF